MEREVFCKATLLTLILIAWAILCGFVGVYLVYVCRFMCVLTGVKGSIIYGNQHD